MSGAFARLDPVARTAYAWCERLAEQPYENFPVASRLLPRVMRPHVAAVYAFAHGADDVADEGDLAPAERLRRLDDWHMRLRACLDGTQEFRGRAAGDDLIFIALGATIRACGLPVFLFEDLLNAFRQDVTVSRYLTWASLVEHSSRSANPVGRLVLRMAGYDDPGLDRSSDALCTALQLTSFWQDLEVDWQKGRLYVPREILETHGASESDLGQRVVTPAWRDALAECAGRTRALFGDGRHVCEAVRGRLGLELRLTWVGGRRILRRLEASGFDVFAGRPRLGKRDALALAWQALAWKR